MNKEELRKINLAVINRAVKLSMFTLNRVVRSDEGLFGSPEPTVANVEFNKLIEVMLLERIKHRTNNKSTYKPDLGVL